MKKDSSDGDHWNSWQNVKIPVKCDIGIIGGTGIYGLEGMTDKEEFDLTTPYGKPSSNVLIGKIEGETVAFIARHGLHHHLLPSDIPFRANIFALKMLGVKYLFTFGVVGSLQEHAAPTHVVLVDQFIDRTKVRPDTFFGHGVIGHVSLGDPVCPKFRALVNNALNTLDPKPTIHDRGTYICMEGPAFSTKAESNMYRLFGGTVIGMTGIPEVKLAREAEMAYCCMTLVTDYDCWHPDNDSVTVEMVLKVMKSNGELAQQAAKAVVKELTKNKFESTAHTALKFSILTPQKHIPERTKYALGPIMGHYLHENS